MSVLLNLLGPFLSRSLNQWNFVQKPRTTFLFQWKWKLENNIFASLAYSWGVLRAVALCNSVVYTITMYDQSWNVDIYTSAPLLKSKHMGNIWEHIGLAGHPHMFPIRLSLKSTYGEILPKDISYVAHMLRRVVWTYGEMFNIWDCQNSNIWGIWKTYGELEQFSIQFYILWNIWATYGLHMGYIWGLYGEATVRTRGCSHCTIYRHTWS